MNTHWKNVLTRSAFAACFLAVSSASTFAEPFLLKDCEGVRGIGVVGYAKSNGPDVSTTNEISEICWVEETSRLYSSHEASRGLELTQDRGGISHYQRRNGGTVSPLNEQLQIGVWESRPDGQSPYIRWTTEGSRSRDELKGYDFVTIEGFLLGGDGSTARPSAATYDVDMQITGVTGSMLSMVFNMFLPMTGTVSVDGDRLTISVKEHMPGMMVGSLTMEGTLGFEFAHPTGSMKLSLENELLAGAPPQMWKSIDLELEDIGTQFSGDEIALVGSFGGEMKSFGGQSAPVTFSFVANGLKQ